MFGASADISRVIRLYSVVRIGDGTRGKERARVEGVSGQVWKDGGARSKVRVSEAAAGAILTTQNALTITGTCAACVIVSQRVWSKLRD